MITVKFYVKSDTYEFTAESVWEAMAMCNRQVIDRGFFRTSGEPIGQIKSLYYYFAFFLLK